jgi:hypothetical protein
LEAVLARGDRRLGAALEEAFRRGFNLDAWSEHFDFEKWMTIFRDCGIDPDFYACRRRDEKEIFPWDHLDIGVSKAFLWSENQKAHGSTTTPHCREQCSHCGAACYKGGVCVERR